MKPINVGLIGIGTVGGGTWTVLNRNAEEITRRAGRPIRITAVADRNIELAMQATAGAARITDDAFALVNDPEIDIIVELIGAAWADQPTSAIEPRVAFLVIAASPIASTENRRKASDPCGLC